MIELETHFTYRKTFLIILAQTLMYIGQLFLSEDRIKYVFIIMIMISFFHFKVRYILFSIFILLSLYCTWTMIQIHPLKFLYEKLLKNPTTKKEEINMSKISCDNRNYDIKDDIRHKNIKNTNNNHIQDSLGCNYETYIDDSNKKYSESLKDINSEKLLNSIDTQNLHIGENRRFLPNVNVSNIQKTPFDSDQQKDFMKSKYYNEENTNSDNLFKCCQKSINLHLSPVEDTSISIIKHRVNIKKQNTGSKIKLEKNEKSIYDNNKRLKSNKRYIEKYAKLPGIKEITQKKFHKNDKLKKKSTRQQNNKISQNPFVYINTELGNKISEKNSSKPKILDVSEKIYSHMRFTIHEWTFRLSDISEIQNDLTEWVHKNDHAVQRRCIENISSLFKPHILFSTLEGGFKEIIDRIDCIVNNNGNKISVKYIYLDDGINNYLISYSEMIKEENLIIINRFDDSEYTEDIPDISAVAFKLKREENDDNIFKICFFLN